MEVDKFVNILESDFYTGIPDSQLKALCTYLIDKYGTDKKHHIIAANEGNCVALAAGYYLATSKVPVVYMQNSGEGNIVNPVASLLNENIYAIPEIFVIGWRGEPNVYDEPQHFYQGKITLKLLSDLDIQYFVLSKDTSEQELSEQMKQFKNVLKKGKSVAFVVKKDALNYLKLISYKNNYSLVREEAIKKIVSYSENDLVISTTGKTSRELFEIREQNKQEHKYDFLTVGSMGHCSSIALGIALNKPNRRIWCIDGDGALLMHMGAMAVIGSNMPNNLIHIVINNESHESVGGMPSAAKYVDLPQIAKGCGYKYVSSISNSDDLEKELIAIKNKKVLSFLEIKCKIGSRKNLGRPNSPLENKKIFMQFENDK